ncbi:MAG: hypothetical protein R3B41_03095 [Candidatus Doudnabacteria bacterium]
MMDITGALIEFKKLLYLRLGEMQVEQLLAKTAIKEISISSPNVRILTPIGDLNCGLLLKSSLVKMTPLDQTQTKFELRLQEVVLEPFGQISKIICSQDSKCRKSVVTNVLFEASDQFFLTSFDALGMKANFLELDQDTQISFICPELESRDFSPTQEKTIDQSSVGIN